MDPSSTYRSLVEAAATGNLEKVRELVSPHSVWHGIGGGGVDDLIARLERFHETHFQVRVEVLAVVANGDMVGAHLRWHSVVDGKETEFDEIELVRVAGGVVLEEWAVDGT